MGQLMNTVALSGGCFQNKLLLEEVVRLLEADGLRVSYTPKSQATTEGWRWVRLLLRQRVISTNEKKQRCSWE